MAFRFLRTAAARIAFACMIVVVGLLAAVVRLDADGQACLRRIVTYEVESKLSKCLSTKQLYNKLTEGKLTNTIKANVNTDLYQSLIKLVSSIAEEKVSPGLPDLRRDHMSTITASNATQLLQALKAAKSGDTIALESGTYSGLKITGLNISGDVTITSKDPGSPAVLTDLTISKSSGLSFNNLEFFVDPTGPGNPFQVNDSRDISFDRVNVHGSLDGNPQNDASAMQIRRSSDVSITNSEFQELANAIVHLDSDNITISGNSFHDLRVDGVRGGGSSFVTISNNYFTDFYRMDGDHPDAIQFWTTNTSTPAHDIIIANNVIDRGDGGPMQGIFIRDETNGALPYSNLQITGNVVIGSMWHGITVYEAANVLVADNIVAGFDDMKARLSLKNVTDVTFTNNKATDYVRLGTVETETETNNNLIAVPTDAGASILNKWLVTHSNPAGSDSGASPPPPVVVSPPSSGSSAGTPPKPVPAPAPAPAPPAPDQQVGTSGADTMVATGGQTKLAGGAGNDVYRISASTTVVSEQAGGGQDLVQSSVSFTLAANVENLELTGRASINGFGNEMSNYMEGNEGSNRLVGNAGNDTLDGGEGVDILEGGVGNDLYIVGATGRWTVIEATSGGTDTIRSMYGVVLPDNVENAVLTGRGGSGVTGNALNNEITGNLGNNRLYGGGGGDTINGDAGNDTIFGETGNDLLKGGQGNDIFVFARGSGADVLTDFTAGDVIDFAAYAKGGVKPVLVDVGADVLIKFDAGNSILLTGLHASDLTNNGGSFTVI